MLTPTTVRVPVKTRSAAAVRLSGPPLVPFRVSRLGRHPIPPTGRSSARCNANRRSPHSGIDARPRHAPGPYPVPAPPGGRRWDREGPWEVVPRGRTARRHHRMQRTRPRRWKRSAGPAACAQPVDAPRRRAASGSRRRSCFSPGRTSTWTPGPGSGTPNGSRSPLTTSVGRPVASSSARERSGRPGGCSGKASATMPSAAELGRGPAGHPGAAGAPADQQRRTPGCRRRSSATTVRHASSRWPAGAGARRPATRYGWVTRATSDPGGDRRVTQRQQVRGVDPTAGAVAEDEQAQRRSGRRIEIHPGRTARGQNFQILATPGPFSATGAGPLTASPSASGAVRASAAGRAPVGPLRPSRSGRAAPRPARRPAWPAVPGVWCHPRRRGSRPPPAPRPGRSPARRSCGRARPRCRPARSEPERTSPDPRSGRFLWSARRRPGGVRSVPAAVADHAVRRPPRAGGASAPVS